MGQALSSVLAGLGLAVLAAALIVLAADAAVMPSLAGQSASEVFVRTFFAVAAFAFVPAALAIALAEARRIQGLPYWLAVGAFAGLLAFGCVWVRTPSAGVFAFADLVLAGLVAGWLYWYRAGRRSGRIAIALAKAGETPLGPELSATRCRTCTAVVLGLGLMPLSLAGWVVIYGPVPELARRLVAQGEKDARARLDRAGLFDLNVTFDNGVATVSGQSPREMTPEAAFAKAKAALAPMVGVPGLLARVDNAVATDRDAAPTVKR